MSAKIAVPCAVNSADTLDVVVYPDGAFEFTANVRGREARVVLSRENFLRMCTFGLDALMKKVGGA